MGLFDFFSGKINCPDCSSPGAKKSGGRVRCPNAACQNFDSEVAAAHRASGAPARGAAAFSKAVATPEPMGACTLSVRYRNFQGVEKTFFADPDSARRKRDHISLCIAPSGIRVALARDRIQNLSEVEACCLLNVFSWGPGRSGARTQRVAKGQSLPTRAERQILGYHKKHGTTSARYEAARAKYPDW